MRIAWSSRGSGLLMKEWMFLDVSWLSLIFIIKLSIIHKNVWRSRLREILATWTWNPRFRRRYASCLLISPSVGVQPSKDKAGMTSSHNQSYNWFLNRAILTESQLIIYSFVHFLNILGDRVQHTAFWFLEVEVVSRLSEPHLAKWDLVSGLQRSMCFNGLLCELLAVYAFWVEGEVLSSMHVCMFYLDLVWLIRIDWVLWSLWSCSDKR